VGERRAVQARDRHPVGHRGGGQGSAGFRVRAYEAGGQPQGRRGRERFRRNLHRSHTQRAWPSCTDSACAYWAIAGVGRVSAETSRSTPR
jgi:hypothetical protein